MKISNNKNMQNKAQFLRDKGNFIFKSVTENMELNCYSKKLLDSVQYYEESFQYCRNNPTEYLKSKKNIVVAKIKIFIKSLNEVEKRKNFDFFSVIASDLISSYVSYIICGEKVFSNYEYLSHVLRIQEFLIDFLDLSNNENNEFDGLITCWQKLNNKISWEFFNLKIILNDKIISKNFSHAINSIDTNTANFSEIRFNSEKLLDLMGKQKNKFSKIESILNNALELSKETIYAYDNMRTSAFKEKVIYKKLISEPEFFSIKESVNIKKQNKKNENNNNDKENNNNKDEKAEESNILEIPLYNKICNIQEILADIEFYITRCRIKRLISKGELLFSEAINEDDSINMDSIYICLDVYREAYQMLKEKESSESSVDIELEAILCSKLGYILFKVLKNYSKSKDLLETCVQLGMSLHPKNVELDDWYRKASGCLIDLRFRLQEEEEGKKNDKKAVYLEQLKDVLKKIDELCEKVKEDIKNNLKAFLEFLLENHPPLTIGKLNYNVEEEIKKTSHKKVLVNVIKYYHPDKYSVADMRKKILMEEITKRLNDVYSMAKGLA